MFCAGCGAPQAQQTESEKTVFQPQYDDLDQKTVIQQDYSNNYNYDANYGANSSYAPPGYMPEETLSPYHMGPNGQMMWFKFVIYVQLFLSALSCLGTIVICAGEISDLNSVLSYYSYYSDLNDMLRSCITLDTVFIVVNVALAVLAIFVRFRLAKFRQNGPMLYLLYLAVTAATSLIYAIIYNVICAQINSWFGYALIEYSIATTITSVITSVVMIVLNHIYFQKRRELFIN